MKIICPNPNHKEDTASFHIYRDGWGHCFGCGFHAKMKDSYIKEVYADAPIFKEDIESSLSRISRLPKQLIRGLELPVDSLGYYIVWPDASYYKQRLLDEKNPRGKYRGAKGVTKPWFKLVRGSSRLIIIEGEINAMSVARVVPDVDIISPGGSGDFSSSIARKEVAALHPYQETVVVVDKDPAGARAAIELNSLLLCNNHANIKIELWEQDANDILVNHGTEALKQRIMGMFREL